MSLLNMFYFNSYVLNMFRTLIQPSSGACDFSIVSPHWSCVFVSVCVGVSVWLGWGGIRVAGFYAQDVSNINTSIIRSLCLFYCITTLVVCQHLYISFNIGSNMGKRRKEQLNNLMSCNITEVILQG